MTAHAVTADAAADARTSAWPRRLALATLALALPLAFFGGSVTTLGAGLAIEGWLFLEPGRGDWFLWFYPVEQWFRDVGTFVEHTHRLLGSAVGILAIATAAACVRWERGSARTISVVALLAVVGQGLLGAGRVLEKSPELAFLHGAFGQAVFALLAATVVATTPSFQAARPMRLANGPSLRSAALVGTLAIYAQIVAGAWLRHSGNPIALVLHLVLLFAVLGSLLRLRIGLHSSAASPGIATGAADALRRCARALEILLGAQIALGILAFLTVYVLVGKVAASVQQGLFPTLHVIGGAALLCASVATVMWTRRLTRSVTPGTEAAR